MFVCQNKDYRNLENFADFSFPEKDNCSRPLQDRAADTLLGLINWKNGTAVQEAVLPARRITALAPISEERATLVMVCLDDCQALHLWSRDGPRRSQPLKNGSVSFFDLQTEHHMSVETDTRVVCFGVDFKVLDQLSRRSTSPITADPSSMDAKNLFFTDGTVHGLASSARSVLQNPTPSSALFLEQVTCAVAAHLLLRLGAAHGRMAGAGGLAPWQLAKVKKLVRENLGRTLQAQELAGTCALSLSHFSRAFRCSTGTSPHAWLISQRLMRAKHLMLTSEAQLAEIALECGFADQSHFTRVFTREEGASPGSWRRYQEPTESRIAV